MYASLDLLRFYIYDYFSVYICNCVVARDEERIVFYPEGRESNTKAAEC